jgi:hypothetical protein
MSEGYHMRLALAILVLVDLPTAALSEGQRQTIMGRTFCPIVARARATGMTDEQIIASALSKGVPQSVVLWAQKNCTSASGSHGKS